MNSVKSLFTKYLAHLAGYIVAGATTVSAISPAFLPPLGKLGVGIAGLIVFAAHHAYQAGQGVAAAQAVVDAVTKAVQSVPKAAALLLMVALGAAGLHGCTQVSAFLGSPTGATVVTDAVNIAVVTAEIKGITAAQINAVAKQALAADSGAAGTLATVAGIVEGELATLKLPAADQAVADVLVSALSAAIQAKVGANATLAAAQADAAVVLQAVITATGG